MVKEGMLLKWGSYIFEIYLIVLSRYSYVLLVCFSFI